MDIKASYLNYLKRTPQKSLSNDPRFIKFGTLPQDATKLDNGSHIKTAYNVFGADINKHDCAT